jgi:cobalt/nickel transport system permease protein
MHIPDGFLSTPVWATFDAVSVPALAVIARRASRNVEDARIPLLGLMGAFVFAAQMINFPVGTGTSSHLVGGALLAIVLGPWAAALVMTAILAIQAFVFQDGGILALGVNIFNMAVVGVFAGYLPYRFLSASFPNAAIFLAGMLSVLVSAMLALSELLISGVPMLRHILILSIVVFAVSAIIEGGITLAAVRAIERLNPRYVSAPSAPQGFASPALGIVMLLILGIAVTAILFASQRPDAIERVLTFQGTVESSWPRRAIASIAGILFAFGVCFAAGKWIVHFRKRST